MFETIEDYRERASKMIEDMNKKWIWLVNKWGTLTKDVFAPYIDKAIEKSYPKKNCIYIEKKGIRDITRVFHDIRDTIFKFLAIVPIIPITVLNSISIFIWQIVRFIMPDLWHIIWN